MEGILTHVYEANCKQNWLSKTYLTSFALIVEDDTKVKLNQIACNQSENAKIINRRLTHTCS
jgi:hypothetical protein